MELHGIPWILHGYFMDVPWNSMDFHRIPWISIDFHGFPWISMEFHGIPWSSMEVFHTGSSEAVVRFSLANIL